MKLPCELVVWKILPAIKARLSRDLKAKGMSQKKIAQVLDLTEAAVSQYLSGKRAKEFVLSQKLSKNVDAIADALSKGKNREVLTFGLCHLCQEAIEKDLSEEMKKEIPSGCVMCKRSKDDDGDGDDDDEDDEDKDDDDEDDDKDEDGDEDAEEKAQNPSDVKTNDLRQFSEFNEEGI